MLSRFHNRSALCTFALYESTRRCHFDKDTVNSKSSRSATGHNHGSGDSTQCNSGEAASKRPVPPLSSVADSHARQQKQQSGSSSSNNNKPSLLDLISTAGQLPRRKSSSIGKGGVGGGGKGPSSSLSSSSSSSSFYSSTFSPASLFSVSGAQQISSRAATVSTPQLDLRKAHKPRSSPRHSTSLRSGGSSAVHDMMSFSFPQQGARAGTQAIKESSTTAGRRATSPPPLSTPSPQRGVSFKDMMGSTESREGAARSTFTAIPAAAPSPAVQTTVKVGSTAMKKDTCGFPPHGHGDKIKVEEIQENQQRERQQSSTPSSKVLSVSSSLLRKLSVSVKNKRVSWPKLVQARPEVASFPLYKEKDYWTKHYCTMGSVVLAPEEDVTSRNEDQREGVSDGNHHHHHHHHHHSDPALLLCSAGTGTGKSVLMPLCLLDAHWSTLQKRLAASLPGGLCDDAHDEKDAGEVDARVAGFATSNQKTFVREFSGCSRVCIVVSQPTRLACIELATYTSQLLAAGAVGGDSNVSNQRQAAAAAAAEALGKRVGYAVGGDSRFSTESEIVFATPGYILNALQSTPTSDLSSSGSGTAGTSTRHQPVALRPTTIVIDEAHCRDIETDLLMAFVKYLRQRQGKTTSYADVKRQEAFSSGGTVAAVSDWPLLRQVVIMSATMDPRAMLEYLRLPPLTASTGAQPLGNLQRLQPREPVFMLTEHQRKCAVRRFESAENLLRAESQMRSVIPADVLEAVLEGDAEGNLESIELDTGGPYRVERYFIDDMQSKAGGSSSGNGSGRNTINSSNAVASGGGGESSCVFTHSKLLFGPWLNSPSERGDRDGSRCSQPLLLTEDGTRLFSALTHFFTYTTVKSSMFGPHAAVMASFILHLLQALRLNGAATTVPGSNPASSKTASAGNSAVLRGSPVSILVFLPGFAEIQLVLQALERLCVAEVAPALSVASGLESTAGGSSSCAGAHHEPITLLRFDEEIFSVPILHSTAVGSPHEHLRASAASGAPFRVILSTPVAESSLTIPNLRVVLDSCEERKFMADVLTGTTRMETAFVNASSLRQRCGRAGRTCDGVVIHLAPRRIFKLSLPQTRILEQQKQQAIHHHHHHHHRGLQTTRQKEERRLASAEATSPGAGAKVAATHMEPLPDNAMSILLRVKTLFGSDTASALECLPSPLSALALEAAYATLKDMHIITTGDISMTVPCPYSSATLNCRYGPALVSRLDAFELTPKGRVVAALPIPLDQALLVYHSFQFSCVEDALLIACGMTVPSLVVPPRMSARTILSRGAGSLPQQQRSQEWGSGSNDEVATGADIGADQDMALSPLEQFYKHLWMQRYLAGFPVPESSTAGASDSIDGAQQRSTTTIAGSAQAEGGSAIQDNVQRHLSEPLIIRALLQQWYTCSTPDEAFRFLHSYRINRSALRSVDISVAQCCQRLVQLLLAEESALTHWQATRTSSSSSGMESTTRMTGKQTAGHVALSSLASSTRTAADIVAGETSAVLTLANEVVEENSEGFCAHDISAYHHRIMSQTSSSTSTTARERLPCTLIDPLWPTAYRQQLIKSLRRLRQAALSRIGQRFTRPGGSRHVQWYDADAQLTRLVYHHCMPDTARGTTASQRAGEDQHPALMAIMKNATAAPRSTSPRPCDFIFKIGFGCIEDRLCAAYIAAFARHTMRGEDGGYRQHHRRLTRNMDVLDGDANHTCTFNVDVRAPSALSSLCSVAHTSVASLTSSAVTNTLKPYLAGTGLQQVEQFTPGTTFALRFKALGFAGLFSAADVLVSRSGSGSGSGGGTAQPPLKATAWEEEKVAKACSSDGLSIAAGEASSASSLLSPVVIPYEQGGASVGAAQQARKRQSQYEQSVFSGGNALVRLASFGISLLVAAQSVLQRLPVDLQVSPTLLLPPTASAVGDDTRHRPLTSKHKERSSSSKKKKKKMHESDGSTSRSTAGSSVPQAVSKDGKQADGAQVIFTAGNRPLSGSVRMVSTSTEGATAAATTKKASSTGKNYGSDGVDETEQRDHKSVMWCDNYGVQRSLTRRDVSELGLAHLFPTPPPPTSVEGTVAGRPPQQQQRSQHEAAKGCSTNCPPVESSYEDDGDGRSISSEGVPDGGNVQVLMSVLNPVSVTRGVYWKVGLPSLTHLQMHGALEERLRKKKAGGGENTNGQGDGAQAIEYDDSLNNQTRKSTQSRGAHGSFFCEVCSVLTRNFNAHCRTPVHLNHLFFSVQHRITREDWQSLSSCSSSTSTNTAEDSNVTRSNSASALTSLLTRGEGGGNSLMSMALHACRVSPLSFLNVLQWSSSADNSSSSGKRGASSRVPPLAIAGSLLSSSLSFNSLQGSPVDGGIKLPGALQEERAQQEAVLRLSAPTSSSNGVNTDASVVAEEARQEAAQMLRSQRPGMILAQHVWVLNLSSPEVAKVSTAPSAMDVSSVTSTSTIDAEKNIPTRVQLVLAGYLAAASGQYVTAFLLNATHTHAHAVMLYDCVVWKLPEPLPITSLVAPLRHVQQGRGWPGVLVAVPKFSVSASETSTAGAVGCGGARDRSSAVRSDVGGVAAKVASVSLGVHEGLHWCTASETCPRCTFESITFDADDAERSISSRSSSNGDGDDNDDDDDAASAVHVTPLLSEDDGIVACTLLLVLQEFVFAQRNMITLADYIERVIAKLDLLPASGSSDDDDDGVAVKGHGVRMLRHYLHSRYQQQMTAASLVSAAGKVGRQTLTDILRDLGCQFVTPPAVLASAAFLIDAAEDNENNGVKEGWQAEGSANATLRALLKPSALAVEGAALEVMFNPPVVVPSRLPSSRFASYLREYQEKCRLGAVK